MITENKEFQKSLLSKQIRMLLTLSSYRVLSFCLNTDASCVRYISKES